MFSGTYLNQEDLYIYIYIYIYTYTYTYTCLSPSLSLLDFLSSRLEPAAAPRGGSATQRRGRPRQRPAEVDGV